MAQLSFRRGATVGAIISLMLAAASAGWSSDQPHAFIEILAVGLVCTLLAVVAVRSAQTR